MVFKLWNCILAWRSDSIKLNADPIELSNQPKSTLCKTKKMGFWNCIVAWRSDSIKLNTVPFEL